LGTVDRVRVFNNLQVDPLSKRQVLSSDGSNWRASGALGLLRFAETYSYSFDYIGG